MTTRRFWTRAATVGATAALGAACGLLDSTRATTVVAGLLIRTPEIAIAGQIEVDGVVAATAWIGDRESPTSTAPPRPLDDADVEVRIDQDAIPLPPTGTAGVYGTTSLEAPDLDYRGGATYTFHAFANGAESGGVVSPAPQALTPAALVLEPAPTETDPSLPGVLVHARGAALSVSWSEQYGMYPYVSVLRADAADPTRPTLVYDTRPTTAQAMLELIAGASTQVTVPGASFAEPGVYAVTVAAADRSSSLLPNTFVGSPILVGSSASVLLRVR